MAIYDKIRSLEIQTLGDTMIYMQSPEVTQSGIQEQPAQSEPVQERPDNIELSPAALSTGAKATDDQFTSQVSDDDGNNLVMPSDGDDMPTITIPKSQQTIQAQSMGYLCRCPI